MGAFARRLAALQQRDPGPRRWLFVPYDQLHDGIGPLASEPPQSLGIVLVECRDKAARRPYHRQKLALVLANLRHFALEQAARGVAVRHVDAGDGDYAAALRAVVAELGPLELQRPAERELRVELRPLLQEGLLRQLPHDGWLTLRDDFVSLGGPPWRMDAFYRRVRQRTGILMEGGKPIGGKYSFDADNRQPWRGEPPAPTPPTFAPDDVTREVCDLVERTFAQHPGRLDPSHLPATRDDAERLWSWALGECLPHFGPFEDAMSTASSGLFHTRISPLLNLHRLLPRRVVQDVLDAELPFNSKEGFVRQVLGWREFVRHVHEATDGLREVDGQPLDRDVLRNDLPLPPVFWGTAPSGLHCLDAVVDDVWREAYSHHITRLMVLGNLATLLGVDARQLSDWFWVAYADAYDWVVEPNVLAMATFAVGELMTTKPYVAGSAYLHKMGDHCRDCAFDPKKTCPITRLYWQFLDRHAARLAANHRLAIPLRNVERRADGERELDRRTLQWVRTTLTDGRRLDPEDRPR
ncbi:MAG: cryptochrome/photolyase family protein [Planctomycetes bacterium]|nr:cryptochrome/photolyase family protein [Planctomycetota bacterium]